MLVLTEQLRARFKEPLGELVPDADIDAGAIGERVAGADIIVAVGDATTDRLAALGIEAGVQVVDGRERRAARAEPAGRAATLLSCSNEAGTISDGAQDALRAALEAPKPARIRVDGEEDLLVLPVCATYPDGTAVAYGQPHEGMVVLRIDAQVRERARAIMGSMERG